MQSFKLKYFVYWTVYLITGSPYIIWHFNQKSSQPNYVSKIQTPARAAAAAAFEQTKFPTGFDGGAQL